MLRPAAVENVPNSNGKIAKSVLFTKETTTAPCMSSANADEFYNQGNRPPSFQ